MIHTAQACFFRLFRFGSRFMTGAVSPLDEQKVWVREKRIIGCTQQAFWNAVQCQKPCVFRQAAVSVFYTLATVTPCRVPVGCLCVRSKERAFDVTRAPSCIAALKSRPHHRRAEVSKQWLYCSTCHGTLFENEEKQGQCAVFFRDVVGFASVRSVQSLPCVLDVDDVFARATADAARVNPQREGSLIFEDFVPRPDQSRWQTTPEAPFQALRSEEAKAALACCNLDVLWWTARISAGALHMPALSETPRFGGSRCSPRRLWPSCSPMARAACFASRQPTSRTCARGSCGCVRATHGGAS